MDEEKKEQQPATEPHEEGGVGIEDEIADVDETGVVAEEDMDDFGSEDDLIDEEEEVDEGGDDW